MAIDPGQLLARMDDSAPISASTNPDVDLELTARATELPILRGSVTKVLKFSGRVLKGPPNTLEDDKYTYLGPIVRLRTGQKVRIHS
jgi:hypothetical protein